MKQLHNLLDNSLPPLLFLSDSNIMDTYKKQKKCVWQLLYCLPTTNLYFSGILQEVGQEGFTDVCVGECGNCGNYLFFFMCVFCDLGWMREKKWAATCNLSYLRYGLLFIGFCFCRILSVCVCVSVPSKSFLYFLLFRMERHLFHMNSYVGSLGGWILPFVVIVRNVDPHFVSFLSFARRMIILPV